MPTTKHHIKYIFFVVLAFSANLNAASLYSITDLGPLTLTGYDYQNLKIKINNSNKIVAWHRTDGSSNSVSNSPVIGLNAGLGNKLQPALTPTLSHAFNDISNSNITVGYVLNSQNKRTAIKWNAAFNTQTSLGNLGLDDSYANAVNSSGQIVGNSHDDTNTSQPFLWANNVMTIVPINNSYGGTADAINDSGSIAGSFYTDQQPQAYFWNGTTLSVLNNINSDVAMSWASDISNTGRVIGGMQISNVGGSNNQRFFRTHAYAWNQTNGLVNLGENISGSSWANSINENQQIVGGRVINILDRQAILWENSTAFNLNSIVQTTDNWILTDATDINALGNIVGVGKLNGVDHAYLLQPFSESQATADLEIILVQSSPNTKTNARAINNGNLFKISITNHGPDEATNIKINSTLNKMISIINLDALKDTCTHSNNELNCSVPQLAVDESIIISLDLNTDQTNVYEIEANVDSDQIDAGINNNNVISKKVNITARDLTQTSPNTSSNTSQDPDSTTQEEDKSTTPSATNPSQSDANDSLKVASGGCSIGNNQNIDPLFFILLMISILKIRHSRRPSLN